MIIFIIHYLKVGDFGLAKLVDRTDDENFITTRLVGTPGYLPPESLKELQVTPKTDVFAFGVVLSEMLTGNRALFRESQEEIKMKSLINVVNKVFQDDEPEIALEDAIDKNLEASCRKEDVYKCPRQPNDNDCGYYVCQYMKKIIKEEQFQLIIFLVADANIIMKVRSLKLGKIGVYM
ncbi:lysM domain receptor-like kinase 10 [Vigna radiata var. radiata]|uniref:LysM domain receptor-like kinase 10 n=1 Tax=Vigna radiata var. radiata TaxID=3916 RepID=A0A3Q0FB56_VIGRR|nr:lysM domain receptor-like kinase 10 [Vigna radiata var. radiata]